MKFFTDLFSDFFARQDTWLRRLDSRMKLVVCLACVLAVLLSSKPVLPFAMFVLASGCLFASKVPVKVVLLRWLPVAGMVLVLVLLQTFMTGATPLVTIPVAGWNLAATSDGLGRGIMTGARVFGSFGLLLLLGFATPAHEIFRAFSWFRVSRDWVEIAMMTYRYIFVLLEETADMAAAQKVRLGYCGWRRGLASTSILAGSVMLRSLEQSERTHEAMIARGYTDEMPLAPLPAIRPRDIAATGFMIAAIVFVYFLAEENIAP